MKLSSLIIFLALTVGLFGQTDPYPKVIVHNSDTVLAFTLPQARKLSVFNEERKECLDIQKDFKAQINELERISKEQKVQLVNMDKIQADYNDIVKAVNENRQICDAEKKIIETQRNDQRKYKWFSIGVGSMTTVFMTYLWITK
jgi:hypothetical protein